MLSERDPFAPPTRCPACGGTGLLGRTRPVCGACNGSGEFIRTGRFIDHSCSGCQDGARPCREGGNSCSWPRARND